MGRNGKSNKLPGPGKDPVIIIENKMTKIDPILDDDDEVTKRPLSTPECESKDESCYLKCGKTLHSKPAQSLIILLVTLDVVFIILEIIYADKVDDIDTCCIENSDFCATEEENYDRYGELADIFHICSLSILSLMVFELFMKIIFTPKLFFDSYFEVFDGVLVLVAFGLDVTLMFDVDLPVALSFIVVFRFWRIIKLVAGILITTKAPGKARFENQIDKLEDEIMVLQANGEIKTIEIEKLHLEILEFKKANEDLKNENSELKRKIYKENYTTE